MSPRRAGWPFVGGISLLLSLSLLLPGTACARQDTDPRGALRTGKYDAAISGFTRQVEANAGDAAARRGLVRALSEVGRYREAVEAARAADSPEVANALGEALYAMGDRQGAEAAFRRAIDADAPDALVAELNLAVLLHERGEHAEAMRRFDRFIDVYNASETLSAEELVAVATAVRYLGATNPSLYKDALKALDEAIAADGGALEPRVRLGDLFLEKYVSPDAQSAYREVLAVNERHPLALLGMARAKHFDGSGESVALVQKALEVNPNLVPARVLLAQFYLDGESDGDAEAEIRRALEVNPSSLEALSMQAGVHWLRGEQREFERVRDRVLSLNPRYAPLYSTLGELAVRRRRYREASDFARQGVALDSTAWSVRGLLGLNELRLGRVDAARAELDRAFAGDPYNVWFKNTLDLLDTYPSYRSVKTPRFELVLHGDEADLLSIYAAELAEEAYEKLSARYGYRPETPVRVEFYPSHADFSVRSVGLAGLGALGVAFGNVLALDSPSARERGEFNWGSTLWHEIAHAVTLGASNHRVPRWLTEGLSVLEERRARAGWGSETSLDFLFAYQEGKLPKASELSESFVRPSSPEALGHAYHHASLVAEWIEETHGFAAIQGMLRAYGEGRGNEQVIRQALRVEPEKFDADFDAWLKRKHAAQLVALGSGPSAGGYGRALAEGKRQLDAGDLDAAKRTLEEAVKANPALAEEGSAWAMLAAIHERQGNDRAAADALSKVVAADENAYDENVRLADLLEKLGDKAGAAAALERAVYVYPLEPSLHGRLAELYDGLDQPQRSVRERRAVVALAPVDRAEALYQLARALLKAGDREGARREVLRALEAAPAFDKAQELLLELRGSGE